MEIVNTDPLIYEDDDGDFRMYYSKGDKIVVLCSKEMYELILHARDNNIDTVTVEEYESQ